MPVDGSRGCWERRPRQARLKGVGMCGADWGIRRLHVGFITDPGKMAQPTSLSPSTVNLKSTTIRWQNDQGDRLAMCGMVRAVDGWEQDSGSTGASCSD